MREYKDCYIAFLDILGFKNLLNSSDPAICEKVASCFDKIQEQWLVSVDGTGKPFIDRTCIKQIVMSDSICYYVDASIPNALAGLIAECIYFQVRMARQTLPNPILIRGAITHGKLYAEGNIVFGNGLVEAYQLEENDAVFPRIILTRDLILQSSNLDAYGKDYIDKFTFIDEDFFVALDFLYLFYGLSHEQQSWKQFAQHVYDKLDCETNGQIREKYLYLRRNIPRAISKFMKNDSAEPQTEGDN